MTRDSAIRCETIRKLGAVLAHAAQCSQPDTVHRILSTVCEGPEVQRENSHWLIDKRTDIKGSQIRRVRVSLPLPRALCVGMELVNSLALGLSQCRDV